MELATLHPNALLAIGLFSRGEAHDAEGFASFFAEPSVYQFANFTPCYDRAAIIASAKAFFASIQAVHHDIRTLSAVDAETVLIEMDVHYWRLDGSHIALPCSDTLRAKDGKVTELRIFMDVAPLADPSITVSPAISVFALPNGKTLKHPGLMRRFFANHEEGKARIADGYPPRWSATVPKWPVSPMR